MPAAATRGVRIAHLLLGGEVRGGELVALALARAARARGDEVIFLAPSRGPFDAVAAEEGFRVARADVSRTFRVRGAMALRRLLRRERIDVLHTHTAIAANVLSRIAGRLAGVPVVSHVHIANYLPPNAARAALVRSLDNVTARLADRVIAVSASTKEALVEQGYPEGAIEVVPNGIHVVDDDDRLGRRRLAEFGIDADDRVAGEIGRLCDVKGQRDLLAAAARLEGVRIVLIGHDLEQGGRYRELLEREARKLGVDDRVTFTGHRSDARALLAGLDVFVLPSRIEGMPIVVLEAMAAGKPVVATAVGGTPELVVDGETGILVPPRDPEALAEALGALLDDPERSRRLGEAGRARVLERFSEEAMTRRILEVYDELVA